ncbi:MAG: carbohydrate ABC transporter permease [Alicyclobacillus sp.]|nr:carbohydrate ABC transporter permease [Alicyclobacillus sp.]
MVVRRLPIMRILIIILACIWSIFPIYWALNTSLMSSSAAQSVPSHFFPPHIDWSSYRALFSRNASTGLWDGFRQSLIATVIECAGSTIVTMFIAVFGAYAFARLQFRFKNVIFYGILATLALPTYATLIPLYRMMSNLSLTNTYTGIILVYVSGFLPLAMWIMYTYYHTIPKELDEAAFIDGATHLGILFRIMLPLALPGMASAAIITFLSGWGQFIFPLVLTNGLNLAPLTVYMTGLLGKHTVPYTLMNATGILTIVVPVLIVVFLNRYIIQGIIAGSVK